MVWCTTYSTNTSPWNYEWAGETWAYLFQLNFSLPFWDLHQQGQILYPRHNFVSHFWFVESIWTIQACSVTAPEVFISCCPNSAFYHNHHLIFLRTSNVLSAVHKAKKTGPVLQACNLHFILSSLFIYLFLSILNSALNWEKQLSKDKFMEGDAFKPNNVKKNKLVESCH